MTKTSRIKNASKLTPFETKGAAVAAAKLLDESGDKFAAMLACCSSVAQSILCAPEESVRDRPKIGFWASAGKYTNFIKYPLFVRTVYSDTQAAYSFVETLLKLGWRRLFMIVDPSWTAMFESMKIVIKGTELEMEHALVNYRTGATLEEKAAQRDIELERVFMQADKDNFTVILAVPDQAKDLVHVVNASVNLRAKRPSTRRFQFVFEPNPTSAARLVASGSNAFNRVEILDAIDASIALTLPPFDKTSGAALAGAAAWRDAYESGEFAQDMIDAATGKPRTEMNSVPDSAAFFEDINQQPVAPYVYDAILLAGHAAAACDGAAECDVTRPGDMMHHLRRVEVKGLSQENIKTIPEYVDAPQPPPAPRPLFLIIKHLTRCMRSVVGNGRLLPHQWCTCTNTRCFVPVCFADSASSPRHVRSLALHIPPLRPLHYSSNDVSGTSFGITMAKITESVYTLDPALIDTADAVRLEIVGRVSIPAPKVRVCPNSLYDQKIGSMCEHELTKPLYLSAGVFESTKLRVTWAPAPSYGGRLKKYTVSARYCKTVGSVSCMSWPENLPAGLEVPATINAVVLNVAATDIDASEVIDGVYHAKSEAPIERGGVYHFGLRAVYDAGDQDVLTEVADSGIASGGGNGPNAVAYVPSLSCLPDLEANKTCACTRAQFHSSDLPGESELGWQCRSCPEGLQCWGRRFVKVTTVPGWFIAGLTDEIIAKDGRGKWLPKLYPCPGGEDACPGRFPVVRGMPRTEVFSSFSSSSSSSASSNSSNGSNSISNSISGNSNRSSASSKCIEFGYPIPGKWQYDGPLHSRKGCCAVHKSAGCADGYKLSKGAVCGAGPFGVAHFTQCEATAETLKGVNPYIAYFEGQCGEGHAGMLCRTCKVDYFLTRKLGSTRPVCQMCALDWTTSTGLFWAIFFGLILIVAVFALIVKRCVRPPPEERRFVSDLTVLSGKTESIERNMSTRQASGSLSPSQKRGISRSTSRGSRGRAMSSDMLTGQSVMKAFMGTFSTRNHNSVTQDSFISSLTSGRVGKVPYTTKEAEKLWAKLDENQGTHSFLLLNDYTTLPPPSLQSLPCLPVPVVTARAFCLPHFSHTHFSLLPYSCFKMGTSRRKSSSDSTSTSARGTHLQTNGARRRTTCGGGTIQSGRTRFALS